MTLETKTVLVTGLGLKARKNAKMCRNISTTQSSSVSRKASSTKDELIHTHIHTHALERNAPSSEGKKQQQTGKFELKVGENNGTIGML